jgi:hypothetical protein
MHDRYRQASARLENDLRSVALQSGIGQVWLESLRLRTSPPRTRREGELESAIRQVFGEIRGKALSSADHDRPEVADGSGSDGKPLSKPEPQAIDTESQAIDPESQAIDPERIAKVASWVKPLWDKLPTALIGDPIEPFAASDPGLVARWLEDAEPGLLGRFGDLEDGA